MTRSRMRHPLMSPQAFAAFGQDAVGYVRQMRSEEVEILYPHAPVLIPGLTVFVLHAADGTPLCITDSREAAIANAWSNELETLSVH